MKLVHLAIRHQRYDLAALCLMIGIARALDNDQQVQVVKRKCRVLKAQQPHTEVPPEATRTLADTAFTRMP